MKYIKNISLLIMVLVPLLFTACSKDSSTNPTDPSTYSFSCVVNGGGYSNQTFTFNKTGVAVSNPQEGLIGCTFTDANGNSAIVTFQGTTTGTYTVNNTKNLVTISLSGNIFLGLTSGSIKVTTLGNIGGDVIGTFSGSGTVINNGVPQNIEISKGTFKAKRVT